VRSIQPETVVALKLGLRPTSSRDLPNTIQAFVAHAAPPKRHRPRMNAQIGGDLFVGTSLRGLADELRSENHLLGRCSSSNPTFQLLGFLNR
jgi:hypothetical protein